MKSPIFGCCRMRWGKQTTRLFLISLKNAPKTSEKKLATLNDCQLDWKISRHQLTTVLPWGDTLRVAGEDCDTPEGQNFGTSKCPITSLPRPLHHLMDPQNHGPFLHPAQNARLTWIICELSWMVWRHVCGMLIMVLWGRVKAQTTRKFPHVSMTIPSYKSEFWTICPACIAPANYTVSCHECDATCTECGMHLPFIALDQKTKPEAKSNDLWIAAMCLVSSS